GEWSMGASLTLTDGRRTPRFGRCCGLKSARRGLTVGRRLPAGWSCGAGQVAARRETPTLGAGSGVNGTVSARIAGVDAGDVIHHGALNGSQLTLKGVISIPAGGPEVVILHVIQHIVHDKNLLCVAGVVCGIHIRRGAEKLLDDGA